MGMDYNKEEYTSLITLEDIAFNNSLWKEYNKLVYDCDNNKKHIKPDENKNICSHCYRNLILPESNAEELHKSEMDRRKKLPSEIIPCDAPVWKNFLDEEKNHQKSMEIYLGFERYRESVTKSSF